MTFEVDERFEHPNNALDPQINKPSRLRGQHGHLTERTKGPSFPNGKSLVGNGQSFGWAAYTSVLAEQHFKSINVTFESGNLQHIRLMEPLQRSFRNERPETRYCSVKRTYVVQGFAGPTCFLQHIDAHRQVARSKQHRKESALLRTARLQASDSHSSENFVLHVTMLSHLRTCVSFAGLGWFAVSLR